jgi:hypothetical protein
VEISLRRHYPDQVHRVEDLSSSSQPGFPGLPVAVVFISIDPGLRKVKKYGKKFTGCVRF